jgi:hypothetical protein
VVAASEPQPHDLRTAGAQIGCRSCARRSCPRASSSRIATATDLAEDRELTASQIAAQQAGEKAVGAGKPSAAQVAELTFEAIQNRFYVLPIRASCRRSNCAWDIRAAQPERSVQLQTGSRAASG